MIFAISREIWPNFTEAESKLLRIGQIEIENPY